MGHIPQQLIDSFKELGLLESEAKIYTALVMFHDAEVKELQELLDLSRPSIYDGLRTLEDRGFIVLVNEKPTTYQAIPPEIALDMLTAQHIKSKEHALRRIRDMKKENMVDTSPPNLLSIYSSKSIDSKIKDMVDNTRESIFCATSGQNLKHILRRAKSDISFDVVIISEDKNIQERIKGSFKKDKARIRTFTKEQIIKTSAPYKVGMRQDKIVEMNEALNMFDYDNVFILFTDDSECLYIPPLHMEYLNAITTKNKAMILTLKLQMFSIMENLAPEEKTSKKK